VPTQDWSGRHVAGAPDPSQRPYEFDDDRYSPYASDLRDDRGSPYYRGLRDLDDDREPLYDDDDLYDREAPYVPDAPYDEPSPGGALRRVLSAVVCLLLTPIGIAAMTYGVDRYWHLTIQQVGAERDHRGLVAIGLGACLLLIVAWLGAVSPIGPMLGGLVWGIAPAVLYLLDPRGTAREVSDLGFIPDSALSGAVLWLGHGAFLMLGVLLVGAGLAASSGRRRART
jgi:hypothetical protein